MSSDAFKDSYREAISQVAASSVAAEDAAGYVADIDKHIDALEAALVAVADNDKALAFVQGDVAEMWHTWTYNLDAARQGRTDHLAKAPRSTEKDSPDVVVDGDLEAQLKFYGEANETARALSEAGYADMLKVGPSDQVEEIQQRWLDEANRIESADPIGAENLRHLAATTSDRITHDGIESSGLSRGQSDAVSMDVREDGHLDRDRWGLTPDQRIEFDDVTRELGGQAGEAFAVAASIQAANYVISAVKLRLDEGSLTQEDLLELTLNPATAAARSTFIATVAGGLTLAAASGVLGEAAQALDPSGISALVIVTVNSTLTAMKATRGEIPWDDAGYLMTKNAIAVSGGVLGAAVGTMILPVVGTIIGSVVGTAVARVSTQVSETVIMKLAVSNGWTYFGIVAQDYELPPSAISELGWDTVDIETIDYDEIDYDEIDYDEIEVETIDYDEPVKFLERGLIGVRRVGYV